MFDSVNRQELARLVQSVITTEVVSDGKLWKLDEPLRRKIRNAMFGPGRPRPGAAEVSPTDQREMLSQFNQRVAGPMIEALPPHTAAWAVLMLYEEFVDAVFVLPYCGADIGGGD